MSMTEEALVPVCPCCCPGRRYCTPRWGEEAVAGCSASTSSRCSRRRRDVANACRTRSRGARSASRGAGGCRKWEYASEEGKCRQKTAK